MLEGRTMAEGKFFRLATPPVWTQDGDFGIVIDDQRQGDTRVEHSGAVVLLIDPELAQQLGNATFDFKEARFALEVRQ